MKQRTKDRLIFVFFVVAIIFIGAAPLAQSTQDQLTNNTASPWYNFSYGYIAWLIALYVGGGFGLVWLYHTTRKKGHFPPKILEDQETADVMYLCKTCGYHINPFYVNLSTLKHWVFEQEKWCGPVVAQEVVKEEEESGNKLVALLREWEYEMGSLEQHDYDALCEKTDRILEEEKNSTFDELSTMLQGMANAWEKREHPAWELLLSKFAPCLIIFIVRRINEIQSCP
jgi:hypothetical protein